MSTLKLVTSNQVTPHAIYRRVLMRPRSRKQMMSSLKFAVPNAEDLLVSYAARLGEELRTLDNHMPLFEACVARAVTAWRAVSPEPIINLQSRTSNAILRAIIETSADVFCQTVTSTSGKTWDPLVEDYMLYASRHPHRRIQVRTVNSYDAMFKARQLMWRLACNTGSEEVIVNLVPDMNVAIGAADIRG